MKPGKYEAVLSSAYRDESRNGVPCLALRWDTGEGHIIQRLYLSERARPVTYRALARLRLTEEDFPEARAYDWGSLFIPAPPQVQAVITLKEEWYQGKAFLKVTDARRIADGGEGCNHE